MIRHLFVFVISVICGIPIFSLIFFQWEKKCKFFFIILLVYEELERKEDYELSTILFTDYGDYEQYINILYIFRLFNFFLKLFFEVKIKERWTSSIRYGLMFQIWNKDFNTKNQIERLFGFLLPVSHCSLLTSHYNGRKSLRVWNDIIIIIFICIVAANIIKASSIPHIVSMWEKKKKKTETEQK